jgi:hypothetical protein
MVGCVISVISACEFTKDLRLKICLKKDGIAERFIRGEEGENNSLPTQEFYKNSFDENRTKRHNPTLEQPTLPNPTARAVLFRLT